VTLTRQQLLDQVAATKTILDDWDRTGPTSGDALILTTAVYSTHVSLFELNATPGDAEGECRELRLAIEEHRCVVEAWLQRDVHLRGTCWEWSRWHVVLTLTGPPKQPRPAPRSPTDQARAATGWGGSFAGKVGRCHFPNLEEIQRIARSVGWYVSGGITASGSRQPDVDRVMAELQDPKWTPTDWIDEKFVAYEQDLATRFDKFRELLVIRAGRPALPPFNVPQPIDRRDPRQRPASIFANAAR
jgi:hypothetical protein